MKQTVTKTCVICKSNFTGRGVTCKESCRKRHRNNRQYSYSLANRNRGLGIEPTKAEERTPASSAPASAAEPALSELAILNARLIGRC